MADVNYVKFMRGTQETYNNLTTKDQDTLYFVYTTANAEKGKLYLGNKLISGSSSIDGEISINDIADIIINENLSDGDVLVYNEITNKWESRSISEAIGIMIGARANENGLSGLVPVPHAGDQLKFLNGGGEWSEVPGTLSEEDLASIEDLKASVATLIGEDKDKSVSSIIDEKVIELLIPENAKESLDTLQEIGDWIQNHPEDVAKINTDIIELQADVANLNDLINGTEGHLDDGLVSRVSVLENTVGDLKETIGEFTPSEGKYLNIGSAISYFDNSITEINNRLRWYEL